MYHFIRIGIYILSVCVSMYSLSCIRFDEWIRKGKEREFYVLYIIVSLSLAYLLSQFIITFVNISYYG